MGTGGEGLSRAARSQKCGRLGCCSATLQILRVITRLVTGEGCKMKINCRRRLIRLMSNQEQPFMAVKC